MGCCESAAKARALESYTENQEQPSAKEPEESAESAEESTAESPQKWLSFVWADKSRGDLNRSGGAAVTVLLHLRDGDAKGSAAQLVIQNKAFFGVHDCNEEATEEAELTLCAEGIVESVGDGSVTISVEKALCMNVYNHFSVHLGNERDFPLVDKKEDFPWRIVPLYGCLAGAIREAQRPLDMPEAEDYEVGAEYNFNPVVKAVIQASVIELRLSEFHASSPWRFRDQVPSGKGVELLFHKWPALKQIIHGKHVFYFLSAKRLRSHKGPLPPFQELMREGGWLRKKTISFLDVIYDIVIEGTYLKTILTVSHAWFAKGSPFDPEDIKMQVLSTYLQQNLEIEEVWFDYGCVPQGERTPEEQMLFDSTLPVINLLYLGTKVLRVVSKDYFERFWPQFEAYLSKQTVHKYGFQPEESDRCSTVFIEEVDSTACCQPFQESSLRLDTADHIAFFDRCTYEQAMARLSAGGVKVTNMSDKVTCLTKLEQLKEFMAVIFNFWG
jgi:hypothetical protein